jgi:hypothetical protein
MIANQSGALTRTYYYRKNDLQSQRRKDDAQKTFLCRRKSATGCGGLFYAVAGARRGEENVFLLVAGLRKRVQRDGVGFFGNMRAKACAAGRGDAFLPYSTGKLTGLTKKIQHNSKIHFVIHLRRSNDEPLFERQEYIEA